MTDKNKIGHKIKNIMEVKHLTLEDVSNHSGVKKELVEKIINDEIIPSLTPLTKIASALGVRLGTFLDDVRKDDPIFIKKGHSDNVIYFSGHENDTEDKNLEFYSLAAGKFDRHMEPFIIEFSNETDDQFELSSHEGEEFIYLLKGQLELCYGKKEFILEPGDSLYYDSIVPHHLHAKNGYALILAVVYTPY